METLRATREFVQTGRRGDVESQSAGRDDDRHHSFADDHRGPQQYDSQYARKRPLHAEQESWSSSETSRFSSREGKRPSRQGLLRGQNDAAVTYGLGRGQQQPAAAQYGMQRGNHMYQQQGPSRSVERRMENGGGPQRLQLKRAQRPPPPQQRRWNDSKGRGNNDSQQVRNVERRFQHKMPQNVDSGQGPPQQQQQHQQQHRADNVCGMRPPPPFWERLGDSRASMDGSPSRAPHWETHRRNSNGRDDWQLPPPPPAPPLTPRSEASDTSSRGSATTRQGNFFGRIIKLKAQRSPSTSRSDNTTSWAGRHVPRSLVAATKNGQRKNGGNPKRLEWNASVVDRTEGNRAVVRGVPEQKRPRLGTQHHQLQQRRDLFGQRWQHCPQEPKQQRERSKLSGVSDNSNKKAFVGRFVPKGGTAGSFDKLCETNKGYTKAMNGYGNHVKETKATVDETTVAEKSAARPWETTNVDRKGPADGRELEEGSKPDSNSADAKPKTQTSNEVAIVVKLPASLQTSKKHSLKDIVLDTISSELTDASNETELRASASYSSYMLAHASVTPSVEIMESPHSLTLPDDETIESETKVEEKKIAASVIVNVPVEKSLERAKENEFNVIEDNAEKDAHEELNASKSTTKETNASVAEDTVKERVEVETTKTESHNSNNFMTATHAPWASEREQSASSDSSDEETDDEELQLWAQKMFGIPPPIAVSTAPKEPALTWSDSCDEGSDSEAESRQEKSSPPPKLTLHLKMTPNKIPCKPKRRGKVAPSRKEGIGTEKVKARKAAKKQKEEEDEDEEFMLGSEEAKRKKEEAKPLTAAEVRKILAEDKGCCAPSSHWVRRSSRQPSRAVLNNPGVRSLVDKLRVNDYDMVVLKMKKYCSDPDTPPMVIDTALDALEENTNCQALYIQVC